MKETLLAQFQLHFGSDVPRVFQAPGRVNLIGEHTDYNDGFVLPLAIGLATRVAAVPRTDRHVEVVSRELARTATFSLDGPPPAPGGWLGYVEGVARVLEERGVRLPGAKLMIESDVPLGAGLSSSAALELSCGLAFLALAQRELPLPELAQVGQQAERRFVGTQCGIMDQLVSALGVEGSAVLIDCRSLETSPVPLKLGSAVLMICDTLARHSLAGSEYNVRRVQCEAAARLLGVPSLRDVTREQLEDGAGALGAVLYRRVHHVLSENARTLETAEALQAGDLRGVGERMNASHASLRDDYQVSAPELDAAADAALSVPGVHGSRMTGGGFGGSTVTLVERASVGALQETLERRFADAGWAAPVMREAVASAGAREL